MKILLEFLSKLALGFLLIAGVVWLIAHQQRREPYDWELQNQQYDQTAAQARTDQQRATNISHAELQGIIADVYHVEQSRFIQPDILWITLPPGTPVHELQRTCQAIANVWAHRSGLDYVCVESWQGGTQLARATVQNQHFVTP